MHQPSSFTTQATTHAARDAAAIWFAKLRDPGVRDSDRTAFARWRDADPAHAAAYDELESVWKYLDAVPAPAPLAEVPRRRYRFTGIVAAAAGAAVLAFGILFAPQGGFRVLLADAHTGIGESRTLTLPDGTEAWLDAGSALSFDNAASERRVSLVAGRAYFIVHPVRDRPFVVAVGSVEVRDIGTEFEVSRRASGGQVAVAEGIVMVSLRSGAASTLTAGESVSFGEALDARVPVSPGDVAAWRSRRLVFLDAPLHTVLDDLERHGAGRVLVLDEALAQRRITGAFDTRAPAEALASILELAGAKPWRIGPVTLVQSAN